MLTLCWRRKSNASWILSSPANISDPGIAFLLLTGIFSPETVSRSWRRSSPFLRSVYRSSMWRWCTFCKLVYNHNVPKHIQNIAVESTRVSTPFPYNLTPRNRDSHTGVATKTYRDPVGVGFLLHCIGSPPWLHALLFHRNPSLKTRTQVHLCLGYMLNTRALFSQLLWHSWPWLAILELAMYTIIEPFLSAI